MRLLVIYFDGLADRPARELGGRTPLEAARTPNIDRLAAEAMNGLIHAKSPGYALGSPLSLHLMFGYREREFPDRGPLLARSRGFEIRDGDVVLAARFASAVFEHGRTRLVERFVRGREEACRSLAEAIAEYEVQGLRFEYRYSSGGDGALFVRGGASHEITDTDPLALDLPVLRTRARAEATDQPAADRTATAVNDYLRWAHHRLAEHPLAGADGDQPPVNVLITKWAGPKPRYEPFAKRWGMRPASLPDEEVVSGLLLEMGFHLEQVANTDPETDLRQRLALAKRRLDEGYEFVHLHSKYPDPQSHDNDPARACEAIEQLDAAMEYYWQELAADPGLVTVLTTDHTTPSVWADWPRGKYNDQHSGEEWPLAVRGGNVRVDNVTEFGERAAAAGVLGHLRGEDFMPVLLDAAERTHMYEMRPTPIHRPYRPRPEDLEALDF